jgi:GNAT superfamily N-acetyltransferase
MPKRSGRKSVAQTPAPKSDKIYGSKKNPKGSASSEKTAKSIKLSEQTEKVLKNKLSEFKEEHPNKKSVTLSDLKAVYRRGSGAYSKSHRPTITGGAPNSRAAWSYARVNKFLKKAGGAKVKAAYVQDDDLFAKGGEVVDIKTKINQYLNGAEIEFNSKEGEYVGNAKISYGRIDKLNSLFDIMARGTDDMGYIAFVDDLKKHGLKPSNKVNFIELIWIEKEFRGKGYASAGLDDIIEAYKEDGAGHLMLSVGQEGGLENKDLIKFYKRHGFVPLEGSIENSVRKYNPTMILDLKQNKLAKGGELPKGGNCYKSASQEINCVNCGWKWETADSDEQDMYLCHQCGFDNTLYYSDIMSKLKKPMSVSEISKKHGVNTQYIENQLDVGIKHELEHTDDEGVAKIIALHHIGEKPNYYELVEKYNLEDGGQPSKFWHQADQYEIADFIQNERMATEELLCSGDTRIAKAIICRAKIDIAEQKEQKSNNLEEKNAWSAVKNIWEECLKDIKNGVVYEYKDGGECGCMSYKDGGLAYGNSHDKGGMPLKVESTGQNIEIEGGEGVINKRSMQMSKKLDFQGKKMTPCQIVSKINEMGGGVKFKCQDVAEILAKDGNF